MIVQNRRRYQWYQAFRFWAGQGSALSAGPQLQKAERTRARPRPLLASSARDRFAAALPSVGVVVHASEGETPFCGILNLKRDARKRRENFRCATISHSCDHFTLL